MRFNRFWCYRSLLFSRRFARSAWRSRRNILYDKRDEPPPFGPYMAELDVTYRCNCRCRMCQRWQDQRPGEMTLGEYEDLARIFSRMGVHQVSIAGGEPLLRQDLFSILACFAERGMSVNLCTNGILLKKYAGRLCRSGVTCVTVSLDGATASTHDAIRSAPGSYDRIRQGIDFLLTYPKSRRPLVRVRMTVSDRNVDEIAPYYEAWRNRADDVLLQPVHYCPDAFYTGPDEDMFRLNPDRLSRRLRGTPFQNDGYMSALLESLLRDGDFPDLRCYAGLLMVRLDPWGNVYPCLEQHVRVGSVREQDFSTLWQSELLRDVRKQLRTDTRCKCWFNNTAMISHYGAMLQ
jgi:MoaA/NifB/PqqE/SkfB family radical SAM enzyme